ncbi:LacI family DNA-binding transcriptional regulator [Tichowtungia aerotolerans]|uniref:LacI family DNA-binding transcriptional regulator n=1 Tax=Tichowtungia aerotolerans TaxID=2697043 RepID=A0A6P1M3A9_9BACT|nr:LacI family DNA-binding transcriptional regulator [Tichowtungia aerotolerans]QHI69329.1 LacI family DNA-binding transcriptional regulator [Tichowtungia aerotolerans]
MSESGKAVTIKDIALECGVTATTVSLALRNHPRISDATKAKVREAAERLNYRRNPMVSALMANLSQSRKPVAALPLAAVYTHDLKAIEENSYHLNIWKGMERRASELGFKLERFYLIPQKMSGRRLTQILVTRGISGIIIPPLLHAGGHLSIDWKEFSAVAIGYSMLSPNLHRICPDQYRGIRMVLRELKQLGYKRPGLLLNRQSDLRTIHLWSSGFYGYEHAQKKKGIIPVLECNEVSEEELQKWYEKYTPDVIISSDFNIIDPLHKMGLQFPEDVGLVTLSRYSPAQGIAGIDQNADALGAAAIEQLVQMMYYNERGIPEMPRVVQIPSAWGKGESICRQVPAEN